MQMPPVTVLSHGARNPMTAAKVEYIDFLPDYPASDPNGYAYIINTRALHPDFVGKALTSVR